METTNPTPKPKPERETGPEQDACSIDLDRYPVEVLEAVLKILRGRAKPRYPSPE